MGISCKRESIYLALLLLFVAISASAQSFDIKGKVSNPQGQGVRGVSIELRDKLGGKTGLRTTSGSGGKYHIDKIPVGKYNIRFSRKGYVTVEANNVPSVPNTEAVMNLTIVRVPRDLKTD